jgi:hypothetical protein
MKQASSIALLAAALGLGGTMPPPSKRSNPAHGSRLNSPAGEHNAKKIRRGGLTGKQCRKARKRLTKLRAQAKEREAQA